MMNKNIVTALLAWLVSGAVYATEGMWIPSLIDMFYSDMKTQGLKLKPEDIYATNKSSLKDAIVQFDGGCTAEIVSGEGLLFTNHHCGFDAIQKHSSLENDYLKNGFWAKSKQEEIACPWMHVTFVKEIRDVTKAVLNGVKQDMSPQDRAKLIAQNIAELEKKELTEAGVNAKIKPFNLNNQYFMLITQDYNDIRLVGAPPSCIGKFGGDTDNWVWPRHTGDFSVFRIYANKDNKPAEYSPDNVPFKPAHFLPINLQAKKEGDFTMVYGFPGRTDQHYSSAKIKFYQDIERPARVAMRTTTLDILRPLMNSSDQIRIQYASKQQNIANAWKKWIGQIGGLKALNAIEKKQKWETEYTSRAASKTDWQGLYGKVIADLNSLQEKSGHFEFARSLFSEYFSYGPEFIGFAAQFFNLVYRYDDLEKNGKLKDEIAHLTDAAQMFFKDYNKDIDRKIYQALTPLYISYLDEKMLPKDFKANWEKNGEQVYQNAVLLQPDKLKALLANFDKKALETLKNDPAVVFATNLQAHLQSNIDPGYKEFAVQENKLLQRYVEGLLVMFPEKKNWADANFTLRLSYGKIEGSAPHDGMCYTHFTTIDGIMQKQDDKNPDFELSRRFVDLYKAKDFGNYTQDDKLWVCFTASNHTTGGNSGSPVIDAKGNLIGINFDRSWESTMSDFVFDPARCRNIAVDVRYVLWVIEKYGEAGHLLNEMKLLR